MLLGGTTRLCNACATTQVAVVGTTCLGIKHAMFSQRRFDVCFVDEASQIVEAVRVARCPAHHDGCKPC